MRLKRFQQHDTPSQMNEVARLLHACTVVLERLSDEDARRKALEATEQELSIGIEQQQASKNFPFSFGGITSRSGEIVGLLTILGFVCYAFTWAGYYRFYGRLGVKLNEVGISYSAVVSRAAIMAIAATAVLLIIFSALLLFVVIGYSSSMDHWMRTMVIPGLVAFVIGYIVGTNAESEIAGLVGVGITFFGAILIVSWFVALVGRTYVRLQKWVVSRWPSLHWLTMALGGVLALVTSRIIFWSGLEGLQALGSVLFITSVIPLLLGTVAILEALAELAQRNRIALVGFALAGVVCRLIILANDHLEPMTDGLATTLHVASLAFFLVAGAALFANIADSVAARFGKRYEKFVPKLGSRRAPKDVAEQRRPLIRQLSSPALALCLALALSLTFLILFNEALAAGDRAADRIASGHIPKDDFSTVLFDFQVPKVGLRWVSEELANNFPSRAFYLGAANGELVLYDSEACRAIRTPPGNVVVVTIAPDTDMKPCDV